MPWRRIEMAEFMTMIAGIGLTFGVVMAIFALAALGVRGLEKLTDWLDSQD
jgi:hypothetical protein